jgi:hypothetical protein
VNEILSSRQNQTRQFELLENTQPGYCLFTAALDGTRAAVGSINIRDGIGGLVAAAMLPATEKASRECGRKVRARGKLDIYGWVLISVDGFPVEVDRRPGA